MIQAVRKVVHEDAQPREAYELYREMQGTVVVGQ